MANVDIRDVYPHKAWYRPGEEAQIRVHVTAPDGERFRGILRARLLFLSNEVGRAEFPVVVSESGMYEIRLSVPSERPRGYGVEVTLLTENEQVVARRWTALDVLNSWTEAPRYGFVCDFPPQRSDIDETMDWLLRYHINALQFYDWMYRHDTLLPPQDVYQDPLGRVLSRQTVQAMIAAAVKRHIASLAYVAVYAASLPFWNTHQEWGLYDAQGAAIPFGDAFLYIMNPEPDSPWAQHLLREMAEAVRTMGFDGVHLDQYGEPREGFDIRGHHVDVARAFASFIEATKTHLAKQSLPSTVVFNAVNNWPIEEVAPTPQDLLYIELWPPHVHFKDLWSLIVDARRKGGGKPVVLAAYMSPAHPHNVRLMNAIIFASGGAHIELGEHARMLADPYFPKHEPIPARLAAVLRRYYDFAVQYENILMLDTEDVTEESKGRVALQNIALTYEGNNDSVWVIARRGMGMEVLNLINLADLKSTLWTEPISTPPRPLHRLRVRYYTDRIIQRIWTASPDYETPAMSEIPFTRGSTQKGSFVEFVLPSLEWWNLIVLKHLT